MWIPALIEGVEQIRGTTDERAAAKYNQMVDAENAQIAGAKSNLNAEMIAREDRYQQGAARAAMSGSGVNTATGSPMDELAWQTINDSYKQSVERYNGALAMDKYNADAALSKLTEPSMESGVIKGVASFGENYLLAKYGFGGDKTPSNTTGGDSSWGGVPYE